MYNKLLRAFRAIVVLRNGLVAPAEAPVVLAFGSETHGRLLDYYQMMLRGAVLARVCDALPLGFAPVMRAPGPRNSSYQVPRWLATLHFAVATEAAVSQMARLNQQLERLATRHRMSSFARVAARIVAV